MRYSLKSKMSVAALALTGSMFTAAPMSATAQTLDDKQYPGGCYDVVITCSRTTGECTGTIVQVPC